jgi:hypothetical protein
MLEVEDWTQPSHNKKRLSSKRFSAEIQDGKEGGVTSPSKPSSSALPPGPPEPEVEDTFMVTHPSLPFKREVKQLIYCSTIITFPSSYSSVTSCGYYH